MSEPTNRPRHRLGRAVAAALGLSFSQQGCMAAETFVVHAVDGRVKVGAGRPDELVDSEAVEGNRLQSLIAAVDSSGDNRLWDHVASPLPRPSAASAQLAALAS